MLHERPYHARRGLWTHRDPLAALVGKGVHLLLNDVRRFAGTLGEQLLSLQYRCSDLLVAVRATDTPGDIFEPLPPLDFTWDDVASTTNAGNHGAR